MHRGWEVVGIRDGYNGLIMPENYPDGGLIQLTARPVRGITHLGGTILGTTNRGNPLHYPVKVPTGCSRRSTAATSWWPFPPPAHRRPGGHRRRRVAAIAQELCKKGLRVVGVPKTIDNDLDKTVITFGFDTAVSFATECLDRLHTTAESHHRVMVVEVMGRYAGWIALNSGISGTADAILIPEIPLRPRQGGREDPPSGKPAARHFSIVVVAEGAKPKGGAVSVVSKEVGQAERLGGVGERVSNDLQKLTGKECRLRGARPPAARRLAHLLRPAGRPALRRGGGAGAGGGPERRHGRADPPTVRYVPMEEATERMKAVPLDCDTILTARDLGICFGD